jgi:hypothetical protein
VGLEASRSAASLVSAGSLARTGTEGPAPSPSPVQHSFLEITAASGRSSAVQALRTLDNCMYCQIHAQGIVRVGRERMQGRAHSREKLHIGNGLQTLKIPARERLQDMPQLAHDAIDSVNRLLTHVIDNNNCHSSAQIGSLVVKPRLSSLQNRDQQLVVQLRSSWKMIRGGHGDWVESHNRTPAAPSH